MAAFVEDVESKNWHEEAEVVVWEVLPVVELVVNYESKKG